MRSKKRDIPRYLEIKNYLIAGIEKGKWKEGDVVPTEQALARKFGVSRMTVNRAVKELTAERVLTRVQGSGTYVAKQKYQATLIAINSIADEVRERGHEHSCEVHLLDSLKAQDPLTQKFEVAAGHPLFHSVIVHLDNGVPIQVEDRWVNAVVGPDYLEQDFSVTTANEYLMIVAPLQGVRYSVEAMSAPREIARMLQIPEGEPCLVLNRTTLSGDQVASVATMWYPGSRYQLEGTL